MPMQRLALQNTNRPLDTVSHWHERDALILSPPYQRGDVWDETRQRNLIRSIVQGIPVASIILNDRSKNLQWGPDPFPQHLAVIDGKQRIRAILKFLYGHLLVPGEWFGVSGAVHFFELEKGAQRRFQNIPLAFSEASVGTVEEESLIFELVNFGGVPQGQSDLS